MVSTIEQRLGQLRHLDDELGSEDLRALAVAEFQLVSKLADQAEYDAQSGSRILSALAEVSRMCGWVHFDSGRHAAAQQFYVTALRVRHRRQPADRRQHSGLHGDPVLHRREPTGRRQPRPDRPRTNGDLYDS